MSLFKSKYALLARREFWEHRSLWMAPAIVGAIGIMLPLITGDLHIGDSEGPSFQTDGQRVPMLPQMFGQVTMVGLMALMGGVATLVIFAYLLDCLYGERKDRSILFWKSLPVSDTETVLTKIAVAVVLTPLCVVLLALVLQPLLLSAINLRFDELRVAIGFESVWGGVRLMPMYAMLWLYGVLWYAPGIAWLMLASVLAKRAPLIYALMPPLMLILLEGILLRGSSVLRFIGERLAPWTRESFKLDFDPEGGVIPGIASLDWGAIFGDLHLWGGVTVAAAMIYGVIRLRRYRDDT